MPEARSDLLIIGGGVMGLFTAYYASRTGARVTLLEKSYIGDRQTASFSTTRSIRNDYLDPLYAGLAYEARQLWLEFQRAAHEPCLIECGCLNIARENVTPALAETYAVQSFRVLTSLQFKAEEFTRPTLQQRFPQFDADLGRLDVEAGLLYVPEVTRTLVAALRDQQVQIVERVEVQQIEPQSDGVQVRASGNHYSADRLVITAGLGTNQVLRQLRNCTTQFPLHPDRPSQCKYYMPAPALRSRYTSEVFPVFAYLDVGIYGHPIYEGKTPGVKIGFYNPPDVKKLETSIQDVASFVEQCLPELKDAESVDVQDVDQCFYDLVADDDFILGKLAGFEHIFVGVGWRGTGYKYAPWVGSTLSQLSWQAKTVEGIERFTPARFS